MSTLPLLPDSDRPKLIGIARLAAEGESIREGHDIEYFTLPTRSLLNRVVSNRNLPFTWAINPYRGCEFACKYCYARYTHEFMEMSDEDFEHVYRAGMGVHWDRSSRCLVGAIPRDRSPDSNFSCCEAFPTRSSGSMAPESRRRTSTLVVVPRPRLSRPSCRIWRAL
jgi:hypothetical protein